MENTPEARLAAALDAIEPPQDGIARALEIIERGGPEFEEGLKAGRYAASKGIGGVAEKIHAMPGSDDLDDNPSDFVKMNDIQYVRDALMDVMLGVRMAADGTRSASGINTHIRFARQPTLAQLIQWQEKLQKALEKL